MGNIYIRGVELPVKGVRAAVVVDGSGDYVILINTTLRRDLQERAKRHELNHLLNNHFQSDRPIVFDELEAR